ncbi:MAG TPA: glycosyl hydrolase family 28-related protein [Leptolyngbyaceae cyanobacterium]
MPQVTYGAALPGNSNVTDVTAFGAKGDGITDDTQAIQRALEQGNRFIYLPNGTYLVCDTLKIAQTRKRYFFQGESRDGAIVKLKDNCPSFGDGNNPKPVISTEGPAGQAFQNSIFDLTVDIGQGNPGAIGLQFLNNNQGTIRNVTVKSSDPNKIGSAGIDLTLPWPGPGLIEDVQIIGFDYGIKSGFPEFSMVFEDINLQNQRVAGIENWANLLSIRGLTSNNSVPVIRNKDDRSLVVLLDGDFQGGSPSYSAIENERGVLYARNITSSGYQSAIDNGSEIISGNIISEYVSDGVYSLFPSPQSSLNLPIEEVPTVPEDNLEDWVSVTEYGAKPDDGKDDTEAIQKAIDSGKLTVYFPKGSYQISSTIHLRGNVQRITGLGSIFTVKDPLSSQNQPVFRLEDGKQNVVILERFWGDYGGKEFYWVEHASSRTLVLQNIAVGSGKAYRNTGYGRLFIKDVAASDWVFNHQQVWARQLNPERDSIKIVNNNSSLWILGMKTEDPGIAIQTIGGGKTEVLGGLLYPGSGIIPDDQPAFINDESQLSIVIGESHYGGGRYKTFVKETRNGETKTLLSDILPGRGSAKMIPLYVGYQDSPPTNPGRVNEPGFVASLFLFGLGFLIRKRKA